MKTLNSLNSFHPHASHPTSYSALCNENDKFNISSWNTPMSLHATFYASSECSSESTFHTSSKCSSRNINHASKHEHLRYSRFPSTRKVFQHHFHSKHPSFDHHSFSTYSIHHMEGISTSPASNRDEKVSSLNQDAHPPTIEEGASTSHSTSYSSKKILGPTKTLDLSEPLGTSISNKSKNTTCVKSLHKIKSSRTSSLTYFSRSSSGTRNSTLSRLVNEKQLLYSISVVSIFIILHIVYALILKLLHLPFDRGKEHSVILMH